MKKDKLHNIDSNGFKAPKDYFKTFDASLMQRVNNESALENIENEGFKVPEGYFDTIEDTIIERIKYKNNTPVISLINRKKLYYISGIAASLLLLFTIFINKDNTEELSIELVENYFLESDLDTYELAELLAEAKILEDNFTIVETQFEEENLEGYLLENANIESILE